MLKTGLLLIGIVLCHAATGAAAQTSTLSDKEIRAQLIAASIKDYSGACACPYSTKKNGAKCGESSAWSKASGDKPLCFDDDVTAAMIDAFKKKPPASQ